jgi:acetyl esterase/lipase
MHPGRPALPVLFALAFAIALPAAAVPTHRDIEYARVGEHALRLDLHLPPKAAAPAPLIVWVHDGAWRSGSKNENPLAPLVTRGWAVASVDYRLTPVAPFPANIHDLKAAIRFLRARRADYGLATERIAIAGASAGAHLADELFERRLVDESAEAAVVGRAEPGLVFEEPVGDEFEAAAGV